MDIKNCDCKTNAVLIKQVGDVEAIVCLKCKTPYTLNSQTSYNIKMPITLKKDGSYESEIGFNTNKWKEHDHKNSQRATRRV